MLFHRLFFSAGVKRTLTEWKRNQFFFFFLHLHLVSAPSWQMEFINQGQITLCLAWEGKKKHEGEEEGNGNEEIGKESQAEVLG